MLPVLLIDTDSTRIDFFLSNLLVKEHVKDIFTYGKDESILIDDIRKINQDVLQPAFRSRAYVLYNFDKVKNDGQNALLKTLEERNEDNIFILIAQNEHKILSTILSRCRIVRMQDKKQENFSLLKSLGLFDTDSVAELLNNSSVLTKNDHSEAIHQIREYIYTNAHADHTELQRRKKLFNILEHVVEIENQLKNNIYPEFVLDYVLLLISRSKMLPFQA